MLTTNQIKAKYGEPGPSNLIMITFPYPMKIAWDLKSIATKTQCHKLVAPKFKLVFDDLLATYGLPELQRLGIDLFGGLYNFRKQRNGNDWSRHAWGIAIDLDPARNALKQTSKTAQFAKPEYKPMIDIFYKHGFLGLGPEKNYDWMHFEIGS
ncbi:MAG TPA: M15 family metallopeptidase [Chitinophagaceae bacterium]|nr:M15 family metallopeptidase [Chitinophagaceae bacterium]